HDPRHHEHPGVGRIGGACGLVRQPRQLRMLLHAEIGYQLALMLTRRQQTLDFSVIPCKTVVRSDVVRRQVRPARAARSHWAFNGRTSASTCTEVPSESRRTSGTEAPGASGLVRECNMMCRPSGSSFTVALGGMTSCSWGRI